MRHAVVAPPELEPLAAIFWPCLLRARVLARAARHARGALLDLGGPGTAAAAAGRLAGIESAEVVGGPFDGVTMAALRAALQQLGIAAEQLEAPGEPAAVLPAPCLLVVEPGAAPPLGGVTFIEDGRSLRRAAPGSAGSIAESVDVIRLVTLEESAPAVEPGEWSALRGWDVGDEQRALATCRELVALAPGRVRLVAPQGVPSAGRLGGAAWAARYGLHVPALRLRLERLVAACFPQHHDFLMLALGLYELGIDPLEEAYAGNALPDRNLELVQNLRG